MEKSFGIAKARPVGALLLCCVALLAIADRVTWASQEGLLAWSSFTIDSGRIGESGPVTVSGTQSGAGVSAMKIRAFGQEFVLRNSDLEQLKSLSVNGMQLSYERGYEDRGGRTLYLQMSSGFTSGIRDRRIVIVNERGGARVQEWGSK